MNIGLFGIMLIFMVIGWAVSRRLKSKFKEYTNVPTSNGMSGAEVAEIMLKENNIFDVEITCVPGSLTDHYNPQNKTINLSNDVYSGRNVAAAAVAAHETGHAVQHATAYSMLQLRSTLVPVVQFSSKMMNYIFMASIFFSFALHWISNDFMLTIIILGQGSLALFSLITLPVEFDASNRALIWLQSNRHGIVDRIGYAKAKNALTWAAMTYVVSALAAVTQLLYWVMMFVGRRD
jgi:hypothetical protein